MKVTRIIHPIGQGGFYSETLKENGKVINVIYDCGGNSIVSMVKYLENYFPGKEGKIIDAVFISHMHEDHINGLDYLLTHYHVRYLILPQLTKDEILEAFLYNYFKNTKSVGNSLIRDIYDNNDDNPYYLNTNTKIIKVRHHHSDLPEYSGEDFNDEYLFKQMEFDKQRDLNLIDETTEIRELSYGAKVHFHKWMYIPFNPPIKTKLEINGKELSFLEYFKDQLNIREISIAKLPQIIKQIGIKKCKEIYSTFFKSNHNSYSMTLFSGVIKPENYDIPYFYKKRSYYPYPFLCWNPNYLYMGDFETPHFLKELKGFYRLLWKNISSLQVPHHGSRDNHQQELYEYVAMGCISIGEKNRYHHPHIEALIGINEMGCEPILVTEHPNTIKLFHYTDESRK